MTADLVAFLRARLDEDEQHARKDLWAAERATPGWTANHGYNLPYSELRSDDGDLIARVEGERHRNDLTMMGRFKPSVVRRRAERVLAEVTAKRRILNDLLDELDERDRTHWTEYWSRDMGPYTWLSAQLLQIMALPYASHPDYRPEWAPSS